jgi:hypothetical protein
VLSCPTEAELQLNRELAGKAGRDVTRGEAARSLRTGGKLGVGRVELVRLWEKAGCRGGERPWVVAGRWSLERRRKAVGRRRHQAIEVVYGQKQEHTEVAFIGTS